MLGKFRSLLFVCILAALFLCMWRADTIYGAEDDIASGTSGTCSWLWMLEEH